MADFEYYVNLFNTELTSLLETKPPVTRIKMRAITKAALKTGTLYKQAVNLVEKFIQKCKPEFKVSGLYVMDSIIRHARHKKMVIFTDQYDWNFASNFVFIYQCPSNDKKKVKRVLEIWKKQEIFDVSIVVDPLMELDNPDHPAHLIPQQQEEEVVEVVPQKLGYYTYESPQVEDPRSAVEKNEKKEEPGDKLLSNFDALNSLLSNPTVLEQIRTLQEQMAASAAVKTDSNSQSIPPNQQPEKLGEQFQPPLPTSTDPLWRSTFHQSGDPIPPPPQAPYYEGNTIEFGDLPIELPSTPGQVQMDCQADDLMDVLSPSCISPPPPQDGDEDGIQQSLILDTNGQWTKEKTNEKKEGKNGFPASKRKYLTVCSTTLWVGHLSKLVSQKELTTTFGAYGDIGTIEMIGPRGCAFISMKTRVDAMTALEKLKYAEIHGKSITLAWAPGQSMKKRQWKVYWEAEGGVSFIPWSKLTVGVNYEQEFQDGGSIDVSTLPLEHQAYIPSLQRESESMNELEMEDIDFPDTLTISEANLIPLPMGSRPGTPEEAENLNSLDTDFRTQMALTSGIVADTTNCSSIFPQTDIYQQVEQKSFSNYGQSYYPTNSQVLTMPFHMMVTPQYTPQPSQFTLPPPTAMYTPAQQQQEQPQKEYFSNSFTDGSHPFGNGVQNNLTQNPTQMANLQWTNFSHLQNQPEVQMAPPVTTQMTNSWPGQMNSQIPVASVENFGNFSLNSQLQVPNHNLTALNGQVPNAQLGMENFGLSTSGQDSNLGQYSSQNEQEMDHLKERAIPHSQLEQSEVEYDRPGKIYEPSQKGQKRLASDTQEPNWETPGENLRRNGKRSRFDQQVKENEPEMVPDHKKDFVLPTVPKGSLQEKLLSIAYSGVPRVPSKIPPKFNCAPPLAEPGPFNPDCYSEEQEAPNWDQNYENGNPNENEPINPYNLDTEPCQWLTEEDDWRQFDPENLDESQNAPEFVEFGHNENENVVPNMEFLWGDGARGRRGNRGINRGRGGWHENNGEGNWVGETFEPFDQNQRGGPMNHRGQRGHRGRRGHNGWSQDGHGMNQEWHDDSGNRWHEGENDNNFNLNFDRGLGRRGGRGQRGHGYNHDVQNWGWHKNPQEWPGDSDFNPNWEHPNQRGGSWRGRRGQRGRGALNDWHSESNFEHFNQGDRGHRGHRGQLGRGRGRGERQENWDWQENEGQGHEEHYDPENSQPSFRDWLQNKEGQQMIRRNREEPPTKQFQNHPHHQQECRPAYQKNWREREYQNYYGEPDYEEYEPKNVDGISRNQNEEEYVPEPPNSKIWKRDQVYDPHFHNGAHSSGQDVENADEEEEPDFVYDDDLFENAKKEKNHFENGGNFENKQDIPDDTQSTNQLNEPQNEHDGQYQEPQHENGGQFEDENGGQFSNENSGQIGTNQNFTHFSNTPEPSQFNGDEQDQNYNNESAQFENPQEQEQFVNGASQENEHQYDQYNNNYNENGAQFENQDQNSPHTNDTNNGGNFEDESEQTFETNEQIGSINNFQRNDRDQMIEYESREEENYENYQPHENYGDEEENNFDEDSSSTGRFIIDEDFQQENYYGGQDDDDQSYFQDDSQTCLDHGPPRFIHQEQDQWDQDLDINNFDN